MLTLGRLRLASYPAFFVSDWGERIGPYGLYREGGSVENENVIENIGRYIMF
jgi:hypothetical protein